MRRSLVLAFALLVLSAGSAGAQSAAAPAKLDSLPQLLEAHADDQLPEWTVQADSMVQAATPAEIRQVLPALVDLTESSNAKLRANTLLALWAIAARSKPGRPEDRRQRDLTEDEAMIPYITRLSPRLMDSDRPSRTTALLLFQALATIRPIPPELIQAELAVLRSPQSTQPMADARYPGSPTSPGPQMLWALLPAAADFSLDPVTHIIVGRDSPEVQKAIIEFLDRPDQTAESLSESIRAITVGQVQDPAVIAELLSLLHSPSATVQKALVQNVLRLRLSPDELANARASVTSIAADPNAPADLRTIANSVLSCWSNDRQDEPCPAL